LSQTVSWAEAAALLRQAADAYKRLLEPAQQKLRELMQGAVYKFAVAQYMQVRCSATKLP
jgi:hypothetical protein